MIHVLVNMDDLTRIERDFGMRRDKTNLVLRAAINNTAKDVKHKMAKGAVQRYALNTRGMEPYKSITMILSILVGIFSSIGLSLMLPLLKPHSIASS